MSAQEAHHNGAGEAPITLENLERTLLNCLRSS
jgi:hypothetical protein